MSSTRHEFIVTASDRTKVAFESAKAGWHDMRKTAISATAAISAGLGGIGVVAFSKEMAEMGKNSLQVADRLNSTTEQITALQYAASKFGVDGESMNGVLQDMSVRIQEFATAGSGEAADFFEGLNLDVKDFIDLAPDQLLYKVAQELENVSDASARVYLDQLGSDNLVALLPVLRNNAEGLRELQDEAYATNKVLKQADAIKLASIANEINTMQNAAKSLSQQLAAEFEPTIKAISQTFNSFASDGDAVSDTLDTMAVAGGLVASVYAGRVTTSFVASAQAKYADTMATRQNAAANVEEAKAVLAKAQVKLTTEQLAYKESIDEKKKDAIESEKASAANLARAKTAQAAAAADLEAAAAAKLHTDQMKSLVTVHQTKVAAVNSQLTDARTKLTAATARTEKAEKSYQAQVAKNSASILVATNNTKKLERAKTELQASTKKLTVAQNAHNAAMRTGTTIAKGFGAAMGLMGGPIGIMMTAITFGGMWAMTNRETSSSIDLLKASTEDLDKTLSSSSASELETMLSSVRSEIDATSSKMKEIGSISVDSDDIAAQSKQYKKAEKYKIESDKMNQLRAVEVQLAAEFEKKQTTEQARQSAIREAIASQELRTNIQTLQDATRTAVQVRQESLSEQLADIEDFYSKEQSGLEAQHQKKLISDTEYSEQSKQIELNRQQLAFQTNQRFALQEEQIEVAQRQKRMAAFSQNYTQREQMTLEHQQRVLAYMQENGITNDQDARVIAYQRESYDYQLKMFQDYQNGILKEYNDYGKSNLQKEKDRYAEEIKLLDKHLKDKDITQKQYDSAKAVADKRTEKQQKEAEAADLEASLNKQREFNDLFVGMADSKNKELAAIGKAAAIYNIGINTYQGAMAAYAALAPIPIVGPALGVAAAAALVAYGVEQVGQVNSQTYHTGGIAGQDSDNYSARLAANEVPAVLIKGEEVLTQTDPRHRNNLTMGSGAKSQAASSNTSITLNLGEINVMIESSATSSPSSIGQDAGEQIATQIVAVLRSKMGQKLVYSGVSAEAGRNGGKIKGVR